MSSLRQRMENAMRRVEDFYFGDQDGAGEKMFNAFAQRYAHLFQPKMNPEMEQNKLEHTVAFQEFSQVFQSKLQQLVTLQGLTVQEFFTELKSSSQEDEDCAVFVHIILSIADYTSFVKMMAAYCKEFKSPSQFILKLVCSF